MTTIHYGGDYNPEQHPEPVWADDIRLMQEASVNLVSLGVFAWARIQPAEGEFDFEWLDKIMDMLHAGGIGVNLATATASPPPWVSHRYPEILPRNESGAVLWHGSRQAYSPASPVYQRLASELVEAIATRYAFHPAVRMWHVNNEYACHVRYDYSDSAAAAFRQWLRERYVVIDRLNDAWGAMFWSQRYTDFEQIVPPRLAPYNVNPGGLLDFKRYSSDALRGLYRMEKAIIRAAGATQPVTTNFMGAFEAVDYRSWADDLDVIADDSYPDPGDPQSFRKSALTRDLMRCLKPGVPWILMEQATSAVSSRASNLPKAPGQMAALSMQAVGRGADGIMFFQWRQSRAGSEKFHSAMVPHAGVETGAFAEVVALGSVLRESAPMAPSVGAQVAILYDWENRWAVSAPDHPVSFDFLAVMQDWYSAVHRQHVTVDIRHPEDDLSQYRVVIAPQLYLLTEAGAHNINSYVKAGGTLLASAFSDVVDEHDRFLDGGFTTRLEKAIGVRVTDFGALALDATAGDATVMIDLEGNPLVGRLFAELIDVTHAEVLGVFSTGRAVGRPALTMARSGTGCGYYVATIPDQASIGILTSRVFREAGVIPVIAGLPETAEAVERDGHLFVINHGTEPFILPDHLGRHCVHSSEEGQVVSAFGWRVFSPSGAGTPERPAGGPGGGGD